MAKRRRPRSRSRKYQLIQNDLYKRSDRRVVPYNSNRKLPVGNITYVKIRRIDEDRRFRHLRDYEDRRRWHPAGMFAAASVFGSHRHRMLKVGPQIAVTSTGPRLFNQPRTSQAQLNKYTPSAINFPSNRVAFKNPKKVITCVRRNIRKEVLHALKKTGKSGQKKPKYNNLSKNYLLGG